MKTAFLLSVLDKDIEALQSGKDATYFLCDLYRKFCDMGHRVVVITMHRNIKKDFIIRYSEKLTVYGLTPLKHGNISAACMFWPEIIKIKKILHREKCDLIHANWCYEYAMAALLENPDKTIITLHDWPDNVCPLLGNFYWRQRQKLGNKVIEKAKHLTTVSPYVAEMYQQRFPAKSIRIIPNFVTPFVFDKEKFITDHPTFISVNNGFSEIKNVKSLITAFCLLRKAYPETRLLLIGTDFQQNGPAYQWTGQNADLTNIGFLGCLPRTETLNHIANADILVHPSIEESFGMTLIEAMQRKTLVIGGESSGAVPWVLGYGFYGITVDVTNPQAICDAMAYAIANPKKKQIMTEKAYRYVNDTFSLEKVADMYLGFYSKVIQESRIEK